MSVNTPPTENIPIFDASVFPSSSGTALTIATGSKYFLTYPVAQGSEIFPSNVTLQSTLSDASGDVGTSGQILSSTGTGTNWINNSVGNSYIEINTSTLPTTLPIPTTANTYVYITGSTGGTITIPTTGVTSGTLINFRNFTLYTINIAGSTYLPYSSISTTAASPYVLSAGCSATFYYNGSIWVQPNLDRTMQNLIVQNTCYAAGLATDSINVDQNHSATAVNVYNGLIDADLNIANTLPSPYTVRIANTTSGPSGGSVHCSNIGFDSSNINNATTPSTGTIKLGNTQTSGPLYIAGGSTSATRTTGPIIIGSDSTASGGINIGTGTNQTVPTVNTVNIGSATYATNVNGTFASNSLNALTVGGAQTVGGNINTGSITVGGALTTGSLTLGGSQTTGDINIGISNATTDIYIGNGTNSTTGVNTGICSVNKLQVGNTTTGNGVGTGSPFRCMIIGRNVGSTSSTSGTITITGAPTTAGNPIVFTSLNISTASNPYFLNVVPTGTNTFDYYKVFYNRAGTTFNNAIVGATGETFNYIAIWL